MTTTSTAPPDAADRAARPSRGRAALAGVLAVAAATAAAHLVAGIVSPPSSPFLAVGAAVVRFAPHWLVEFAKSAFGTADKWVLLGVLVVVAGLLGAGAGLLGRRDPQRGTQAVIAIGVLGLAAVAFSPTFGLLDLVAPAAALLVGPSVLRWLLATSGPGATDAGRRTVLGSSLAVGAGALAAGGIGHLLIGNPAGGAAGSREEMVGRLAGTPVAQPAPPIPAGADFVAEGTPPFITPNDAFYRIDTALRVPVLSTQGWTLRVHGMVDRELTLSFDDVLARPLVERVVTLVCVSNEVGDDLISTARFTGVDLRALLLEAGVQPGADQVLSTSVDGWTAGTPTDVLLEPDRGALLAIGMNGEPLPIEHGYPARLVVPGLYGFVSATKWVTEIELTTFAAKTGYWQPRGWATLAPVKTQSRIDFPRRFHTVAAGRVPLAGIAWSQPDGISRVEVRLDDGPWRDAELAADVGGDTWRMWRAFVDAAPGQHVAQVRATDGRGVTQTEQLAPPAPDGATGWHKVLFTAG